MAKRPTHKKCRQCGEWFMLGKYERLTRKFCTYSCASTHRNAQPKWKKRQSKLMKKLATPEVMRERSLKMWRDPAMRAHLSEKSRQQANTKEHHAWMIEHNKKLWTAPEYAEFRQQHSERTRKTAKKQWDDPAFREKISALTTEANKKRWADPEYKKRVGFKIRIAFAQPLSKAKRSKSSRKQMMRPEQRTRISKLSKELWQNPEYRALVTESSRAAAIRNYRNPFYRVKKLAALRKWVQSPEGRAQMSELNKKRWEDPEYRARQKALWTPEKSAALSELNRKRWADPKFKKRVAKKISKARLENTKTLSEQSERSKKQWADPEFKARVSKKISKGKRAKKKNENTIQVERATRTESTRKGERA
jgi:hypothetical protein